MKGESSYVYLAVLCALTAVTGAAIAASVTFYKEYRNSLPEKTARSDSASLSFAVRTFVVESFDPQAGNAVLSVVNKQTRQQDRLLVRISSDATVFRQSAVRTNGVITAFTPLTNGSLSDLSPGVRGTAMIHFDKDGAFAATTIIVGDPFPRP